MHPAYSVIFFTTASGAGYGLLIWIAAAWLLGRMPENWWFGFFGVGIALALVAGGLLSSTLHLGRPERAMKAFSQWRTSWLSREGVAAVATFVPAGLFALAVVFGVLVSIADLTAILTIIGALITVWCTGMIYASLTTIRAWNDDFVAPLYVVLALATGGVLYCGLEVLFAEPTSGAAWMALIAVSVGWILKAIYWSRLDGRHKTLTPAKAIGLEKLGKVKPIEPAHTQANFIMREMGYEVARKHADKLRVYAIVGLFAVPADVPPRAAWRYRAGWRHCSRSWACWRRPAACWPSAGCSSPRRSTWCRSITVLTRPDPVCRLKDFVQVYNLATSAGAGACPPNRCL